MWTAEGGTDAVGEFAGGEETGRFGDAALAVQLLRLDRVESGTLDGQEARDDADTLARRLDGAIVRGSKRGPPC